MTIDVDLDDFAGTDPVYAIAEEVFSSMIDGAEGFLRVWDGPTPELVEEIHAWVDVQGVTSGRILLSTERSTADGLARALLGMAPTETVEDADLVDALGEVANVVGGNVKALVRDPGVLSLPVVAHVRPSTADHTHLYTLTLDWRGCVLVLGLWQLA